MRDPSALIATVDQAGGMATITVRGEFGPAAYARLQDRLGWVAANCPRRLVLDLGTSDRFTEQLITVIAGAQQQLPEGCQLEIRSASPATRNLLELAGWTGVQASAARQQPEPARPASRSGIDGLCNLPRGPVTLGFQYR
jgi:hypothetical protein